MSRPENSEREALVEHERSKERVGARIGNAISAFFDWRLKYHPLPPPEFRLAQLESWTVRRCGPVVGGSVSRIMRDMRLKGRINYTLVSRHKSLYRALPLEESHE